MDKGQILQIISAVFGILAIVFGFWGSHITGEGYGHTLKQFSMQLIGLDQKIEKKIHEVQFVKSKIAMAKQQLVPPNIETKLNFDQLIYNTHEGFWQEGRPGFCDKSGIYDLSLTLHVEGLNEETPVLVIIETSNQRFSRKYSLSRVVSSLSIKKSFDIDLGDTVVVSLLHKGSRDMLISSNDDQTYLTIQEIDHDS
jgi:hypothetical protein